MNIWKGASLGNCQFKSLIDKWTSKTNISKLERRKDQEIVLTIFTEIQDNSCKMVSIFTNVLEMMWNFILKKNIFFFSLWFNFVSKRKNKEELSRDLSVGCPNPTQDRQHFRIPDENYMSTFQFADFAPDKIQFQITSEISQGLWTKTSNFDGIAVGGSSNGNTYHPPHRPALISLFLDFYWNRIWAAKISWNINQDHQLLS